MQATTRANAALNIAANQFMKAKQDNPNADDGELIDNLQAVPDVIKNFLKTKVASSAQGTKVANLQTPNPLMQQQQVYQQLTERLTRPFRPQMSQGQPVGGVQLPPQKALEYLHNDPDFQSLPQEYQDYAIGVVGGQTALQLHKYALANMQEQNVKLQNKAAEDQLQFGQAPTRMVEKNLTEGKWFVDANNKLMKKEKNPISGMEEISPLSPWETLHAVREAPKTGFGDLSSHIDPNQQAGLALLKQYPNASVSDIVSMVAKGGDTSSLANLQSEATQSPERMATLAALNAEKNNLSPERIATMRAMGLPIPQSSSSGIVPRSGDLNNMPAMPVTSNLPTGYGAGTAVRNFVAGGATGTGGLIEAGGAGMVDKVIPTVGALAVNTAALADKGVTAGGNFLAGLLGQPTQASAFGITPTSPAGLRPGISNFFRNTVPDWLVKKMGANLSNESMQPAISEADLTSMGQ